MVTVAATETDPKPKIDIAKVNRSQLARDTGTDIAHISRIFNLRSMPSLFLACRIALALHITVDDLCVALRIDLDDTVSTIDQSQLSSAKVNKKKEGKSR